MSFHTTNDMHDQFDYPPDMVIREVLRRQLSDIESTAGNYFKASIRRVNPFNYLLPLLGDWQRGFLEPVEDALASVDKPFYPRDAALDDTSGWPMLHRWSHAEPFARMDDWLGGWPTSSITTHEGVADHTTDEMAAASDAPSHVSITMRQGRDGTVETRKVLRWADGREEVSVTRDGAELAEQDGHDQ